MTTSTDYWSGLPEQECWLSASSNIWNVLAPPLAWDDPEVVLAMPCKSREAPEKPWYWLLLPESNAWRLRVPQHLCHGNGPRHLPGPGSCFRGFVQIYTDSKRRTSDGQAWEPSYCRRLYVIRLKVPCHYVPLGELRRMMDDQRQWRSEKRASRGHWNDGPSAQWSKPSWRIKDKW